MCRYEQNNVPEKILFLWIFVPGKTSTTTTWLRPCIGRLKTIWLPPYFGPIRAPINGYYPVMSPVILLPVRSPVIERSGPGTGHQVRSPVIDPSGHRLMTGPVRAPVTGYYHVTSTVI
ncbi:hypothetical protein DPMN_158741 [Dreissena polymorpha]|uniref:Uncharacterized protein n=1 Tax=Dreissena polymorpha TaxID=45954 RepID=A0A9D4EJP2_DREPO|nr:hypothetical protein DPMN_158741 [Dreissena polymorpha]